MKTDEIKLKLFRYIDSLDKKNLIYIYNHLISKSENDDEVLTTEIKEELDTRYNHFLENFENYPDWDNVKQKYNK